MSWLQNVGNTLKKAAVDTGHFIGDAQNNKWVKGTEAALLAGSGLGIPASAAIMGGAGALGGAMRHGGGLKGALTQGAQGALTGAAAGAVGDVFGKGGTHAIPGLSKVGHALGKTGSVTGKGIGSAAMAIPSVIGKTAKNTFMNDGGLDLGKLAGLFGAYESFKGNQDQRSSAEAYNNSNIDQRNQLMDKIMAGSTAQRPDVMGDGYNLPDISGIVKDAAAPVQGPNITPNMNPNALPSKKLSPTSKI